MIFREKKTRVRRSASHMFVLHLLCVMYPDMNPLSNTTISSRYLDKIALVTQLDVSFHSTHLNEVRDVGGADSSTPRPNLTRACWRRLLQAALLLPLTRGVELRDVVLLRGNTARRRSGVGLRRRRVGGVAGRGGRIRAAAGASGSSQRCWVWILACVAGRAGGWRDLPGRRLDPLSPARAAKARACPAVGWVRGSSCHGGGSVPGLVLPDLVVH